MAYERGNKKNIIVGAAAFFIGAENAILPVGITGAGTSDAKEVLTTDSANWTNVGFTSEGVEVSYEPDYGDVEVDQLLDSARVFKQSMRVTVNTTLAEATLENLLVVWGQKAGSLNTGILTIEAGDLGDEPVARALAFVGPAPRPSSGTETKQRIYQVDNAIQTESSSHALRRSEATALPVSFRILPSGRAGANNAYGTVRDRVYA